MARHSFSWGGGRRHRGNPACCSHVRRPAPRQPRSAQSHTCLHAAQVTQCPVRHLAPCSYTQAAIFARVCVGCCHRPELLPRLCVLCCCAQQERKATSAEIKDGAKGLIDVNPPRGGWGLPRPGSKAAHLAYRGELVCSFTCCKGVMPPGKSLLQTQSTAVV